MIDDLESRIAGRACGSGTFLAARDSVDSGAKAISSMSASTSVKIRDDRANRRDQEAAAIITAERLERETKTARLRALRLAATAAGRLRQTPKGREANEL